MTEIMCDKCNVLSNFARACRVVTIYFVILLSVLACSISESDISQAESSIISLQNNATETAEPVSAIGTPVKTKNASPVSNTEFEACQIQMAFSNQNFLVSRPDLTDYSDKLGDVIANSITSFGVLEGDVYSEISFPNEYQRELHNEIVVFQMARSSRSDDMYLVQKTLFAQRAETLADVNEDFVPWHFAYFYDAKQHKFIVPISVIDQEDRNGFYVGNYFLNTYWPTEERYVQYIESITDLSTDQTIPVHGNIPAWGLAFGSDNTTIVLQKKLGTDTYLLNLRSAVVTGIEFEGMSEITTSSAQANYIWMKSGFSTADANGSHLRVFWNIDLSKAQDGETYQADAVIPSMLSMQPGFSADKYYEFGRETVLQLYPETKQIVTLLDSSDTQGNKVQIAYIYTVSDPKVIPICFEDTDWISFDMPVSRIIFDDNVFAAFWGSHKDQGGTFLVDLNTGKYQFVPDYFLLMALDDDMLTIPRTPVVVTPAFQN